MKRMVKYVCCYFLKIVFLKNVWKRLLLLELWYLIIVRVVRRLVCFLICNKIFWKKMLRKSWERLRERLGKLNGKMKKRRERDLCCFIWLVRIGMCEIFWDIIGLWKGFDNKISCVWRMGSNRYEILKMRKVMKKILGMMNMKVFVLVIKIF